MKISILYRFKIYHHLVVDDNRNVWELPHCYNKRTRNLRKLTYYEPRKAYRYNNGYIKKETLYKLMYRVSETFGFDVTEPPF